MRQGPHPKRMRGGRGDGRRPHGPHGQQGHGGGQSHRPQGGYEGGGEGRVRGNVYQVLEKYLALARDATSSGDRIAAENYFQHAEHYYRVINANAPNGQQQSQGQQQNQGQRPNSMPAPDRPDGMSQAEQPVIDGDSEPKPN